MNELKNKLNIEGLKQLPWKRIGLIGAPCVLIVALALVFSLLGDKPAPAPVPEVSEPAVVVLDPSTPSPSPSAVPAAAEEDLLRR